MKFLATAALLLSMLLPLNACADSIPQQPDPKAVPSTFLTDFYKATVVLYRQSGDDGSLQPSCTATSIMKVEGGYFFMTASHCIDPGSDYYVTSDAQDPKVFWMVTAVDKGNISRGLDYAVLYVPTTEAFPVVELGTDPVNLLGEPVVSVSAPLGMGKQVLRGSIATPYVARSVVVRVNGKVLGNWKGSMLLQMPGVNPASSGSAVGCVNQRAVCGIIVGVISTEIGQEAVALPISRLADELKAHLPKK
jgi:hypothetical protein